MIEPQIKLQLERISRIAKQLPRENLETFLLDLVDNFLQREAVLSKWVERLEKENKC
jgi:hypothetical protein